jgi:Ran GTPase-activating protein (RanGAP) involved in mRNA processing and transport
MTTYASSVFSGFCAELREDDPTVLPSTGNPFKIRAGLTETQYIELSAALLESSAVKRLELDVYALTEGSAQAIGRYLRASKCLVSVSLDEGWAPATAFEDRSAWWRNHHTVLTILLRSLRKSTSLEEFSIKNRQLGRASHELKAFLIHTKSLRKLALSTSLPPEEWGRVQLGLSMNTTLVELALIDNFLYGDGQVPYNVAPIPKGLHNHPSLKTLRLEACRGEVTGIENLLISDKSKITQVIISFQGANNLEPAVRLTSNTGTLLALARYTKLTRLNISDCELNCDCMRQLCNVLRSNPHLQSLGLSRTHLLNTCLVELAPALYHNVSIKELDLSRNDFESKASATLIRNILRRNKGITKLDLTGNEFGGTPGAVQCIADGLASNATLIEIVLADTRLDDDGLSIMAERLWPQNRTLRNLAIVGNHIVATGARVLDILLADTRLSDDGLSILAESLWPQNQTLRKLSLVGNQITATGIRVLVDRMVESNVSCITDLNLGGNSIGREGAISLANALERNSLPHLKRLSLSCCSITDDGFLGLMSALARNDSLLFLDLRRAVFSRQAYGTLSESLPRIKVLQQICLYCAAELYYDTGSIYNGLLGNTSILQVTLDGGAPATFPPSNTDAVRCGGGWMQGMQFLGDRNRFLSLMRAPLNDPLPRGLWPHALAKVATRRAVLMHVLRSKPNLVAPAFGAGDLDE